MISNDQRCDLPNHQEHSNHSYELRSIRFARGFDQFCKYANRSVKVTLVKPEESGSLAEAMDGGSHGAP